ncbi:AraC family transcriptional regulator [Paucibacter soli]|uniref:AraC family transcriptional regulator n=1 Tax=Paucibacter soli TaxID=3133433 RepID=UPI0030A0DE2C
MFKLFAVPPDLQPWLEAVVILRGSDALRESRFPAMLTSMLVLRLEGCVHCHGHSVPRAAWIAPHERPTVFAHEGGVHAVGLVLRPEFAACLLGGAARGLRNSILSMDEVLGRTGETAEGTMVRQAWAVLQGELRAHREDESQVTALLRFTRAVLGSAPDAEARRQQALSLWQAASRGLEASDLARPSGLGRRQFERRFVALWGFTPKQVRLLDRFNSTLHRALSGSPQDGAQLALEQGFFDQAHMGRDMRRLAGGALRTLHPRHESSGGDSHWPLQVGIRSRVQPSMRQPRKR